MLNEPKQDARSATIIIGDIEELTHSPGFIYSFAYMALSSLSLPTEQLSEIDWHSRPNPAELSFVLGLMIKQPLCLSTIPTDEIASQHITLTAALLDELHQAHTSGSQDYDQSNSITTNLHESEISSFRHWMKSGQRMIEPIFYGGGGAYDFQYLGMATKRYKYDEQWLENYLSTSLDELIAITEHLRTLAQTKARQITPQESFTHMGPQFLNTLSFTADDLRHLNKPATAALLKAFAITPGTVNRTLDSLGDYNAVNSHPIVDLDSNRFFLPIFINLAESIYESPFYWMLQDSTYKSRALKHRGATTEEIATDFLGNVFGHKKVYRGLQVSTDTRDLTDIDAFASAGNKAVILQAKSKKLTVASRQGHLDSLISDFQKAIQDAYTQGLTARSSLLGRLFASPVGTDDLSNPGEQIDDAYILCITGDHYPAVAIQSMAYLEKDDSDPYPIAMSIFDLETVTFYLSEPEDLLYYLRQRSLYGDRLNSDSEMALLGFHLSRKLFPSEQFDFEFIGSEFAQLVDANYPVATGHWPRGEDSERLFHKWKNESFDEIVGAVKSSRHRAAIDILFLLYDLAGDAADNITGMMAALKRKTRVDGRFHDASFPLSRQKKGLTLVSFAAPQWSSRREQLERDLGRLALARKHKSKADEWLGLASVAGSDKAFDMLWYSKEPWRPDAELDDLVRSVLKPGTFVKADNRKVGRNESCPCGSGLKFKRCHDRLRYM